eukprot:scaffold38833_cov45-Tisochrysis_lutea.AAC.1
MYVWRAHCGQQFAIGGPTCAERSAATPAGVEVTGRPPGRGVSAPDGEGTRRLAVTMTPIIRVGLEQERREL